jgi:4a-hydroxytetrahydrobiopterin dehydratase
MSRPAIIPQAEMSASLAKLSGWKLADDGKAIERRFKFADFSEAFAFMARGALAAEKLDHHPEWSNVYNRVDVRLSTHDAGGVTSLDIELAGLLDKAGLRGG